MPIEVATVPSVCGKQFSSNYELDTIYSHICPRWIASLSGTGVSSNFRMEWKIYANINLEFIKGNTESVAPNVEKPSATKPLSIRTFADTPSLGARPVMNGLTQLGQDMTI